MAEQIIVTHSVIQNMAQTQVNYKHGDHYTNRSVSGKNIKTEFTYDKENNLSKFVTPKNVCRP